MLVDFFPVEEVPNFPIRPFRQRPNGFFLKITVTKVKQSGTIVNKKRKDLLICFFAVKKVAGFNIPMDDTIRMNMLQSYQ